MCECLDDAGICEICGITVAYREFSDPEPVLAHLVDHAPQEDGVSRSVWERHTRESCLDARARHWAALICSGLPRTV